jgi:hypothetical protein
MDFSRIGKNYHGLLSSFLFFSFHIIGCDLIVPTIIENFLVYYYFWEVNNTIHKECYIDIALVSNIL